MGDLSPIPPAFLKEKRKRDIGAGFTIFEFCPYISIYIIKKVPKTRANAVFPDAREGLKG